MILAVIYSHFSIQAVAHCNTQYQTPPASERPWINDWHIPLTPRNTQPPFARVPSPLRRLRGSGETAIVTNHEGRTRDHG